MLLQRLQQLLLPLLLLPLVLVVLVVLVSVVTKDTENGVAAAFGV